MIRTPHHSAIPEIPDSEDDCLICRLKAEVASETVLACEIRLDWLVAPFVWFERNAVVDEPCFGYLCRGPPTC